jgi:hypothetical protein
LPFGVRQNNFPANRRLKMAEKGTKPYVKLASTLVLLGMGIFGLERYGLGRLEAGQPVHLDGTLLSLLVIIPVVLVIAGALVFIVGRMRRL